MLKELECKINNIILHLKKNTKKCNLELINCSDNGVSLGEKSNLISETINIKNSDEN